ncbi:MAG TPA: shikimate kinase [Desulfotignum sp.]|nr:shikimate kinase [Desulfotignum sp.]
MPCNPVLIGYRCCGKTSVGKCLAQLLSYGFVDTDQVIESRFHSRIDTLVAEKGWAFFRQAETRVMEEVIGLEKQVIATGGGMVLAEKNRSLIQARGFAVWLTADVDTIVKRLVADLENQASRPRFSDVSMVEETRSTLARRTPLYQKLATMTVDTTCHTPREAARMIKRRLDDHVRIQFR